MARRFTHYSIGWWLKWPEGLAGSWNSPKVYTVCTCTACSSCLAKAVTNAEMPHGARFHNGQFQVMYRGFAVLTLLACLHASLIVLYELIRL